MTIGTPEAPIFTSSGRLIPETVWKNPGGRIVSLSWTDDLTLVCITQDGTDDNVLPGYDVTMNINISYCLAENADLIMQISLRNKRSANLCLAEPLKMGTSVFSYSYGLSRTAVQRLGYLNMVEN